MDPQPPDDGIAPSASKRPLVNEYHGTPVQPQNRGVEACQRLWNREIDVGTFDDLLCAQLENALKEGRTRISVVDVGSGVGNLFRDFLQHPQVGQRTRAFLAEHPDFHIDLVGITDAKTEEEFLTRTDILPDAVDQAADAQLRASNIHYTLTYNQRLADVLQENGIEAVDLCTSTLALIYLGPRVFINTLEDALALLTSGGQMIAYDYAGIGTGIVQPDPMMLTLDIRGIDDIQTSSLQATLKEQGTRFHRIGVSIEDEEKMLIEAEDFMVRIGIRTAEDNQERRRSYEEEVDDSDDKLGALTRRSAYLLRDENALIKRHTGRLREIKKRLLDEFYQAHKDEIEGEFTDWTIYFKKK